MNALILAAALAASSEPTALGDPHGPVRLGPHDGAWVNAVAAYPWTEGALYQVLTAPGRVTDIALEPGERLAGTGPVAAGDTSRWIIGETESGEAATRQTHVLIKPIAPGLTTNLVITTERRTYHLELRATQSAYMAAVSWRYPAAALAAITTPATPPRAAPPPAPRPPLAPDLTALNFGYRIEGKAHWAPIRVFDDGRRVAIEFPPAVTSADLPPLFLLGEDGTTPEIVNYRFVGHRMLLDRLFPAAELRMGAGARQERVRLVRTP